LIAVLVAIAVSEWIAYAAVSPVGDRWQYWNAEAAPKFSVFRELVREGETPAVVIVGDSSAARDIAPAKLGAELARENRPYNLAWPANFPFAFRWSTIPLLRKGDRPPEVVVLSLSPTGFVDDPRVRRFEASILGSPYIRSEQGDVLVADWCHLARVRRCAPWRASWFTGSGLESPEKAGDYLPMKSGKIAREAPQTGRAPDKELSADRLEVVTELMQVARDRKFQVLIVVPPRWQPSTSRIVIEQQYVAWLNAHATADHVSVLDMRSPSFLDATCFADAGHLNPRGAALFSKALAPRVRELLH